MNFQGLKALIRLQAHRLLNHSLDDDFIVLGFKITAYAHIYAHKL